MQGTRTWCTMGAAAIALGSWGSASAALIVNGGFETGDLTGWTVTGAAGVNTAAYEGSYSAWAGEVGGLGYFSQDVATTPGETYTLDFALANWGGPPNVAQVTIGGALSLFVRDSAAFDWTPFSLQFTATDLSTTIEFGFRQDPEVWSLDNVDVTPIPEPTSVALIGVTTGLLLARRRHS